MRTVHLIRFSAMVLLLALSPILPAQADHIKAVGLRPPADPSLVSINGRQLIVRNRNQDGTLGPASPYTMRGVCWSPASRDTNTSTIDPNNAAVRRPEFAKWFATDIPLMKGMNVNTVRTFIHLELDGMGRAILDDFYRQGIMVIMTVDDGINDLSRIEAAVNFYKDHPAILMWMLGSEWNINRYFGVASSVEDAARRTEIAAARIKTLDNNHPVATSYGDIDIPLAGLRLADSQNYINNLCPSVDVWALNIYRGNTFQGFFDQWKSITSKPMFIGEFGTDAFRTTSYPPLTCPLAGFIDDAAQSDWVLSLWLDLFKNLSARNPNNVAIGGTVFEWNSEWWKVSPAGRLDNCGHDSNQAGHPDKISNEEYYGVLDIDRQPRKVYNTLKAAFDPSFQPPPVENVTFRAVSAGCNVPLSSCGFAEFFKGNTSLYRRTGGGGGGRGFNVAAINPQTGELIGKVENFDTWLTRDSGSAMAAMADYLASLPDGTLVLIAVGDDAGLNFDNSCERRNTIENISGLNELRSLGSGKILNYCFRNSWAMVAFKGEQRIRDEALDNAVTVSAQTSLNFAIPCPTVTGISPASGATGTRVNITGTNLSSVSEIKFANGVSAPITVNSSNQISVTVPAGAVTGPITVIRGDCGEIQTATFTVSALLPSITSAVSDGKKILTISGTRFGNSPRVLINGIDRTKFINASSDTAIRLKGKKKKLGLKTGSNTVQVIDATGSSSNVFNLII